jgi:hypothetical protein
MTPIGSSVIIAIESSATGVGSPKLLSMHSANHCRLSAQRRTSTLIESLMGLPTSSVPSSARSSERARTSSAQRSMICLRSTGAIRLHRPSSNATLDTRTVRSMSSASASATRAITRPSQGQMSANVLPDAASTNDPSMNSCARGTRLIDRCSQSARLSNSWFTRTRIASRPRCRTGAPSR